MQRACTALLQRMIECTPETHSQACSNPRGLASAPFLASIATCLGTISFNLPPPFHLTNASNFWTKKFRRRGTSHDGASRAAAHGLIKRIRVRRYPVRTIPGHGFSRVSVLARMAQAHRTSYRTIIVPYSHPVDVYRSTSQHFHSLLLSPSAAPFFIRILIHSCARCFESTA